MKVTAAAAAVVAISLQNGVLGGVALILVGVTVCLWILNRRLDSFAQVAVDQSDRIAALEAKADITDGP